MFKFTARSIYKRQLTLADTFVATVDERRGRLGKFAVDRYVLVAYIALALVVDKYPDKQFENRRRKPLYHIANEGYYWSRYVNGEITDEDVLAEAMLWYPIHHDVNSRSVGTVERNKFLTLILDSPDEFYEYFAAGFTDVDEIARFVDAGIDAELAGRL